MKLDLAISPCPNDTFIFYHFIQKNIRGYSISPHFMDIEKLNRYAMEEQRYDITKLSFACFYHLQDQYEILDAGNALGRNCGPLWISHEQWNVKTALEKTRKIATPGHFTTAHALLQLFLQEQIADIKNIEFVHTTYDQIIPSLIHKKVDSGLVIHEERFTFPKKDLHAIQDLGTWWEKKTKLPIPLGCIVAKKDIHRKFSSDITRAIRSSLETARKDDSRDMQVFIQEHAQALDPEVIQAHIDLYVNDFSMSLGKEGEKAQQEFFKSLKELEK